MAPVDKSGIASKLIRVPFVKMMLSGVLLNTAVMALIYLDIEVAIFFANSNKRNVLFDAEGNRSLP